MPNVDGFTAVTNGWVYQYTGSTAFVGAAFAKVALTENIAIEAEIASEGDSNVNIKTTSIDAAYNASWRSHL